MLTFTKHRSLVAFTTNQRIKKIVKRQDYLADTFRSCISYGFWLDREKI